jgi:hypothetical protein
MTYNLEWIEYLQKQLQRQQLLFPFFFFRGSSYFFLQPKISAAQRERAPEGRGRYLSPAQSNCRTATTVRLLPPSSDNLLSRPLISARSPSPPAPHATAKHADFSNTSSTGRFLDLPFLHSHHHHHAHTSRYPRSETKRFPRTGRHGFSSPPRP